MKRLFVDFMTFAVMVTALVLTAYGSDNDGDGDGNGDGRNSGGTGSPTVMGENVLSGTLTGEQALGAREYILNGTVAIESRGRLNILVGTTIKAHEGFSSYLLVVQGGKLYASGTADKSIIFTTNSTTPTPGYWGGIITNDKAPISGSNVNKGDTGLTEVNSNYKYSGNVSNDNSGSLVYVKICYTGARSTTDIEHNELILSSVGNAAKIENTYILESTDDAVEFLGGTVGVADLLAVDPDDDMFDFTQGYSGKLKSCYGVWEGGYTSMEADLRDIEVGGNLDDGCSDHLRQSDFAVGNMIIVSNAANTMDNVGRMQDVIKIRHGAKTTIANALVKGSGGTIDLIDTNDSKGVGNVVPSISITHTLNFKNKLSGTLNTFTEPTTSTGADASLFTWSGYSFSFL